MRAVGQADRGGRARHLLHGEAVLEIAEAGAAIFFLHRDAVQAERADLRPEIARKLVAAVDLGGARRDLVGGEVENGLADRVRSLAEVEIEHLVRVRDHWRPPARYLLLLGQALARGNRLVTEEIGSDTRLDTGDGCGLHQTRPCPGGGPGCNRVKHCFAGHIPGEAHSGEAACTERSNSQAKRHCAAREKANSMPLADFDPGPSRTVRHRYVLAVFRPAAQGRAGALLQGLHVRPVLVGDQVQRHHGGRHQSRRVLLGLVAWRHHHPRHRRPTCAARASSRWTSRAIPRSARPWRRCSRRPISTSWRSTSASARQAASTICPSTKCSISSTPSRSS